MPKKRLTGCELFLSVCLHLVWLVDLLSINLTTVHLIESLSFQCIAWVPVSEHVVL